MKRILAAAVLILGGAGVVPADAATVTGLSLVRTGDYLVPCASMDRDAELWMGLPTRWEPVDVAFKAKVDGVWVSILQAPDGLQFTATAVGQRPWFACAPLPYQVTIPASWTVD